MCRTLNSDINTNIQTLINRGTVKRVNHITEVTVTKPYKQLEIIVPDTACNSAKAFITDLKIRYDSHKQVGDGSAEFNAATTNSYTSFDNSGVHIHAPFSSGFMIEYTVTCQIIEFY